MRESKDEDVLFDGTYLDLIINNLLSNAFKYTEEGESIHSLEIPNPYRYDIIFKDVENRVLPPA